MTNDPATATSVGVTALPYFFDTTAAPGQQYFYWVKAENATTASLLGQSDAGVRASATQQGPVPPLDVPPPPPTGKSADRCKGRSRQGSFLGRTTIVDNDGFLRDVSPCWIGRSLIRERSSTALSLPIPDSTVFSILRTMCRDRPACRSTMRPDFTTGRRIIGTAASQVTPRKSQSYINAAYGVSLFWDGRGDGNVSRSADE